MNTFIKTFVGDGVVDTVDQANAFAKHEKVTILSAQTAFSCAGTAFERPILTVVFEKRQSKVKKSGDGDGGGQVTGKLNKP